MTTLSAHLWTAGSPRRRIRHGSCVRPATVPPTLRRRVFRGTDAVRCALLTPNQLRGSTWRRLLPDVYVHRDVPVTHGLRAAAAAFCLPDAFVTGCSAAVLWGVDLVGPEADVEVTVPPTAHQRRIPGLVVRRAALLPEDLWRRSDVPVTTAEATAVRVAGLLPGDDAVAAVDRLVSPSTGSSSEGASSRAWTSPGRNTGSRSSTTGCGTPSQASSPGTGGGSTSCTGPGGGWSS
jgi:hypothetical protein